MKNKNSIILIICIIISLLIISMICLRKQDNDLTVELSCIDWSVGFDIKTNSYTYKKIELTPKQQKQIIKLYKRINTSQKEDVQLVISNEIKLEFSDGNIIYIDDNNNSYGYINNEYCIRLSTGFKKYILNIIDK